MSGTEKNPAMDDETRRKFKEALAKKNAHGGTDVSDHGGGSKVGHGRSGSGGPQMFRRKAGG